MSGRTRADRDKRKWIQKAVPKEHKGLLHEKLHVPKDKNIPLGKLTKALHSKNETLRHEAQFAENMRNLKH